MKQNTCLLDDHEGRIHVAGNYDKHECGMKITKAIHNDTGEWRVEVPNLLKMLNSIKIDSNIPYMYFIFFKLFYRLKSILTKIRLHFSHLTPQRITESFRLLLQVLRFIYLVPTI